MTALKMADFPPEGANCSNLEGEQAFKIAKAELEAQGAAQDPDVTWHFRWGARTEAITFNPTDFATFTLADLKSRIKDELGIPLDRQKFLGIRGPKGGPPQEDDLLSQCAGKKSDGVDLLATLVGTPADKALIDRESDEDVMDDFFDSAFLPGSEEELAAIRNSTHLQRLKIATEKTALRIIFPLRPDRKLCVMDLDYTLFDCKMNALDITPYKRPYLDEFMASVYQDYDIAIWSATSWRWVELKCTELGFLTSSRFHISFVLDRSSMFSVRARVKGGTYKTHEIKALEIIYHHLPQFGPHNCVHIDDLSRNFVFNPRNGIKVSSYKVAKNPFDQELKFLGKYLKQISRETDLSQIDHAKWKQRAKNFTQSEDNRLNGETPR